MNSLQHPPQVAAQYAREIRARLGNHLRQLLLFGSQARGDAGEGSDFDFVVVVDKRAPALREAVIDAGAAVLNSTDRLCSALYYDEEQWRKVMTSPLGINITKEGVVV